MKKLQTVIFHPIIAALYPIIALLAFNIDETPISSAWRAVLSSLVLMSLVWFVNSLLLKDRSKAAILTSAMLIVLFAYGHLNGFTVTSFRLFGLDVLSHRYLLPISLLLMVGTYWMLAKRLGDTSSANSTLNLIGLLLIAFPLYQIITFQITLYQSQQATPAISLNEDVMQESALPDIYLIILDMYPRQDYLLDVMEYDNSAFIQQLRNQDFYVADCTLSNYSITRFSLTALLNMNYIDTLMPNISADARERSLVDPLLKNSFVRQTLEELGYQVVAFHTDFPATSLQDADFYFENANDLAQITDEQAAIESGSLEGIEVSLSDNPIGSSFLRLNLNKFEWLLVQTTAFRVIPDLFFRLADPEKPNRSYLIHLRQYELNTFMLDKLDDIPEEIDSPKFVFFHIISPHTPVVFTENGDFSPFIENPAPDADSYAFTDEFTYVRAYNGFTGQITYINKRMGDFVQNLLSGDAGKPIIIIQGDHGPPVFSRPEIQENEVLAAYYLPDGGTEGLYPNISPVNLFRHIFNHYFGTNYEFLDDLAFTSDFENSPYDFERVLEEFDHCKN
ncbi:MAG: hypothetical protein DWQ07_15850 [Chloroflexi bacterium]|nr:MAG: hypothetical protein DWQ07_15850 [Chloroflexota bacterium]MBL1195224.1 hypothetical protein [Chloroflexota bacterium]NOH12509.1 sulfatase-like hydrolase/transferase [Chloroflexota bacterium]